MTRKYWKNNGAYIPFPLPVIPDDGDNTFPVPDKICVPTKWLPFVQGALKVLCRPETWDMSEEDTNNAVRAAMGLLSAVTDVDCDPPLYHNWGLAYTNSAGGVLDGPWDPPILEPATSKPYNITVNPNFLTVVDFTVRGYPIGDFDLTVGGDMWWAITGSPDGAPRAVTLIITHCDGGVETITDVTPISRLHDDVKSMRVLAGNALELNYVIYQHWLCGPA